MATFKKVMIMVVGLLSAHSAYNVMARPTRAIVRSNAIFTVTWLVNLTNANCVQYASNRKVGRNWTANVRRNAIVTATWLVIFNNANSVQYANNRTAGSSWTANVPRNAIFMVTWLVSFTNVNNAQYASNQGISFQSLSMALLVPSRAFSHE